MKLNKEEILARINQANKNTLMETLEIEYTDIGENYVVGRMPVTPKVHQPDGVLHGGASVALAESVGSVAAFIFLQSKDFLVRGIEIAANHVKGIREGYVYAKATALHRGRTTQLWHIPITNEDGELISLVKLTTITLPKSS